MLNMKNTIDVLIKIIIIILFVFTWRVIEIKGASINKIYLYLYIILIACSLLSDKFFYRGQRSENKKDHELTGYYLSLTWFISLILPVLEHALMNRYSIILTVTGTIFVITGIVVRGIGIRTLGKYFSRDVETWDNQQIVNSGIYQHIRHPAYAGNMLQVLGFPLILNSYYSLIMSLLTIGGFLWRIHVEEEFLMKELPGYKEYMKKTSKIIPRVW